MIAIIGALLPVLVNLIEETPTLVSDAQKTWTLLTSDTPATDDQQAQFDAACDAAHAALQASAARQDV